MKKVISLLLTLIVSIILVGCNGTEEVSISFETNGGSNISSVFVEVGSTVSEPNQPVKVGYTFLGWYSDTGLNNSYDFSQAVLGDLTLYAKWDIVIYNITYYLDGGTNGTNPTTYTIETATIPLAIPTKEGYTFNGWFDHAEFTGDAITEIILGSIEDIELYSSWTINQYIITYNTYDNYDPLNDIPLLEGETIISISLGVNHSSAITSEGRVFTWGQNNRGQLGDGTQDHYAHPTLSEITSQFNLGIGETVTSMSLGRVHSSAITSEGRVFTWGDNDFGQLGDGTTTTRTTPTEITNQFNLGIGETVTSMSLGYSHSSAITSEGRVFTWGVNWDGLLGDGTITYRTTPTEITSKFNLGAGEMVTTISLGGNHSSAITSEGRVFTWGSNIYGGLGDGTTTNRTTPTEITSQFNLGVGEIITSISLGNYHSSAITSEGRVFTWGFNFYGGLGDGTITYRTTPTEITSHFNLDVGETIISISLGDIHSSAITSEGRVFTWGVNWYGQLGDGTTTQRNTPTEITSHFNLDVGETVISISLGINHSSGITSEGRIFTWGWNYLGGLGDGTTTDRYTPQQLPFKPAYSTETASFDYNESLVEYIPIREGYTFDGWYSDAALTTAYIFTTMPAVDCTLYGKWIISEE